MKYNSYFVKNLMIKYYDHTIINVNKFYLFNMIVILFILNIKYLS